MGRLSFNFRDFRFRARLCMDIYLRGQDYAWTYIFWGNIIHGHISLRASSCMDIYIWGQDYARIYVFGGKIMQLCMDINLWGQDFNRDKRKNVAFLALEVL